MNDHDRRIRELKEQMNEIRDELGSMGNEAREGFAKKGEEYAQLLRDKMDYLRGRSKDVVEKTQRYAEENPWQVMTVGLLSGIIIGIIVKSAIHRSCRR